MEAQVVAPVAAGGALLAISRIARPTLPNAQPVPRIVTAFTEEQRAAMRAAAPVKSVLFSPAITVYPGGVSLVRWGTPNAEKGYQTCEAWVPYDLTSITVCGDFEVGRTRYLLMGFAHSAVSKESTAEIPSREALAGSYQLVEGDKADAAALEPLRALLVIYAEEGERLAAAHAAIQARQQAYAEWEQANPEPPRSAEIRFWSMDPTTATAEATSPR